MSDGHRSAAVQGLLDIWALLLPIVPFGLVYGVLVAEADVSNFWGWLASPLTVAGASQLTLVTLVDEGTAIVSAMASAVVINARHLMYSAAMAPDFTRQPRWFRLFGSFFILDQTFALMSQRPNDTARYRRVYLLTMGLTFTSVWTVFTTVGIVSGNAIPESWEVGFAVTILFMSLVVNGLGAPPTVIAAGVGFGVAAVAGPVPNRVGLLFGAFAGVLAGTVAEVRRR